MSFDEESLETMKMEIESILRHDNKFGPLHRIESAADDTLILAWGDELRKKAKSLPSYYMKFMEDIADCLSDFGYCLEADEGASETERNNYMLIVPEGDFDFNE